MNSLQSNDKDSEVVTFVYDRLLQAIHNTYKNSGKFPGDEAFIHHFTKDILSVPFFYKAILDNDVCLFILYCFI